MCPMSERQVPGSEAGRGAQGEDCAGEPIRTCQNTYQNLPEPARTYPNLSEPIRTRQRRSGAYQTAGKPPLPLQVSCPHVMWRASMALRCPSGGCPRTHTWRHLGGLQVIWAASRRTPRVGHCLYECRPQEFLQRWYSCYPPVRPALTLGILSTSPPAQQKDPGGAARNARGGIATRSSVRPGGRRSTQSCPTPCRLTTPQRQRRLPRPGHLPPALLGAPPPRVPTR